jgi:glycosyltransferase involved in cell wall biosynthesis
VDDGSTDGSLEVLKSLKRGHPELHIVSFAANAGQTAAFAAGFRAARGEVLVTLDADGQNDPADIPALLDALARGGAARGRGVPRGPAGFRLETPAKPRRQWCAQLAEPRDDPGHGCSLKAFRADAVRDLPLFTGMHRFLPTLVKLHGGAGWKSRCATGRGASGPPSTGCGTAYSIRWPTRWRCAGCSAACCATE